MTCRSYRFLTFTAALVVTTGTQLSWGADTAIVEKNPQTYTVKKAFVGKSGSYIKDVDDYFDPSTMTYRPGYSRTIDKDGAITSYFFHKTNSGNEMSVTSLPYLLALQDVFNGSKELDLTFLGEHRDGRRFIGGQLMSLNYLAFNQLDWALAKSTTEESLGNLIQNVLNASSPTRKIYGTVLLGLRYSQTKKHGPEIAETLKMIYESSKSAQPWNHLGDYFFGLAKQSLAEVRAAAVFAMHLLDYTEHPEENILLEPLRKAKSDSDELVRMLALESERTILKGNSSNSESATTLDSILQRCRASLRVSKD